VNGSNSPSLRDRKKSETRARIHKAGLRLFERKGFANTTVAEIAEAANVSPRTVFVHYPTKEDIVFGDVDSALAAFESALGSRPPGVTVVQSLRGWLAHSSAGWLEPDVELQVRLADEVPSVAERKVHVAERFQARLADAFATDLDRPPEDLRVQLAASAMVTGLLRLETMVSEQLRTKGRLPPRRRLEQILDQADRFVAAGIEALE
jgi:AcrR family transcriptional regulator